jgi:hypothetical protein
MFKTKGFAIQSWSWGDYADWGEISNSLKKLSATGATSVIIDAHLINEDGITGNRVGYEYQSMPRVIEDQIIAAKRFGFDVWFKPVVFASRGGPDWGDWPWLAPTNRSEWFASYKSKMLEIAAICERQGVSHMCISSEFYSLTTNPENLPFWADLISSLRKVYSGKLGTSCLTFTTSEILDVPQALFDMVDFIGLSCYPVLQKGPMSPDTIAAGWLESLYGEDYLKVLSDFFYSQSKPIYFTEFGSPPYADGNDGYGVNFESDLQSQKNFYSTSLSLLQKHFPNEIDGVFVFCWLWRQLPAWLQNTGSSSPYDWNVYDKPAEAAIKEQFLKPIQIDSIDIYALPFSQNISGTPKLDRVFFSDSLSAAAITTSPSSALVQLKGQTYYMQQVERMHFIDKVLALDTAGDAGQAYRIYKAAFDRTPDGSGLGYWIAQMDNGMDMVEVAARFVDSKEFRDLYGTNPTNAQFLTKLYQNVLGRTPEATGYNWWLNELNTNPSKTKAKVLADFSESSENQTSVAALIGNGITYEPWVG